MKAPMAKTKREYSNDLKINFVRTKLKLLEREVFWNMQTLSTQYWIVKTTTSIRLMTGIANA